MSLALKYLVVLNLLIVTVWLAHFAASRGTIESTMLAAEREGMEQLAHTLTLHIEDAHRRSQGVEAAAPQISALAERWPGLDIMVIDRTFTVRLASNPARIGKQWFEREIESVLDARMGTAWNLEHHTHDGRRAMDVTMGVRGGDGAIEYAVHIARWLDRLHEAVSTQRRHDMLSALGELGAVALLVNLLTISLVLRPLRRIRRQIAESGWLDEHPRPSSRDEIRHLETVVSSLLRQVRSRTDSLHSTLGEQQSALREVSADRDHLADRVEHVRGELAATEARLIRAERIAALAQLSGALAHELRNPLHIIRGTAETLAARCPEGGDLATDIQDEVDRVNRLISELLDYTRPSDLQRRPIEVRELLEDIRRRRCRGVCRREPETCALCPISVAGPLVIEADPVLLEQALVNLHANAREASPQGGPIEMAARAEGDEVVISIGDRGPGIDAPDQERVFEPFFTRKPEGTGLGLPVVQKIADLHEGLIELLPRDGGGTEARLRLPIRSPRGET